MKFNGEVKVGMWGRACALLVSSALLVSCGGSQVEKFQASRVMAFGDEYSVITAGGNGSKFTINNATDCSLNPIWIQLVASTFGLVLDQCRGTFTGTAGKTWAVAGAKVDGVRMQIDSFLASPGSFNGNDLVMVLAGMNDIIEQYQRYDPSNPAAPTADTLIGVVEQRGTDLGAQIIRITDAGAKVIISTVPDLVTTPYAAAQKAAFPLDNRYALLSTLTKRFNAKLRLKLDEVKGGGRSAGLIAADDLVQFVINSPSTYGYTNVTSKACISATPNCTDASLVPSDANGIVPTAVTWLWADDFNLSPGGHAQLGQAAASRATSNPF
jgi:phospholipase/lecithinase/hemolysin